MEIKLYPHQEKVLKETEHLNRVAYYLDMGLGKTFVASEKLKRLGANKNIIICQKSLMDMWVNHFKTYYPQYEIFTPKNMDDFKTGILVINYDLVWRRPQIMAMAKDATLICDESSLLQNVKSKRTKFIMKLSVKNAILLSGTPVSGKYENLWSQVKLLGWDISHSAYQKTYVNWYQMDLGLRKIWTINKSNPYKNVDRLKSKLREHGAVFMKTEDVFELPSQTFNRIEVNSSPQYRKFRKEQYLETKTYELLGDNSLTFRLGLRQLCGMYSKEKLKAVEDLINSTEDRLIIFYNYNDELNQLTSIIKNRPISVVNGQTKDLTAYENEDNSVTLIQYQAGAMGLNLQKCNKTIYYTPTDRSELYEQSKKRTNRIGQERPCFYYNLVVKGSIEESIYAALDKGKDYTDELFKEEF